MGSGISPGVTLAVYEDMAGKIFSVGEAFVLLGFASILIPIFMAEPGVRGWFARTNNRLAELVGLPVVASNWQLSMRKAQPVIRVALGAVFTALIMFLPTHIWGMIGIVVGGLLRCARSGSLRFGWRRHLRHNPAGYEVARGRNQRDCADQACRPPDSSSEWGWRLACTI